MKPIKQYFDTAIKKGASDIHLIAGEKPAIRVEGELVPLEDKPLPEKELETAVLGILSADQKKEFLDTLELDMSDQFDGVRFRVNVHRQEGKIGLAARLIPKDIPTPDDLRFEPPLREFANLIDGLVLVVGPTGHGKSTTLASLIEEINKDRKAHIVTIEDPIEFLFEAKESVIEQREVGIDTKSFAAALKHVLRQDPNVIMVGEMRDPETIATALTAAETGQRILFFGPAVLHEHFAAGRKQLRVHVMRPGGKRGIKIALQNHENKQPRGNQNGDDRHGDRRGTKPGIRPFSPKTSAIFCAIAVHHTIKIQNPNSKIQKEKKLGFRI